MRIAHFLMGRCNPESSNGVDKTIYNLSRAQAEGGDAVAHFSVTPKAAIEIPGVEVRVFAPRGGRWRVPAGLIEALVGWRPDVVHLHSVYTPANWVVAKALRQRGIPYIVTPNGGLSRHVTARGRWRKIPYKYLFERPLLRGAVFVHAVGDEESIRDYCGEIPTVTAPNAVDDLGEPVEGSRADLDAEHPTLRGRRLFMFLGRLDPHHKGLDLLLEAFSQLPSEKAALAMVGPDFKGGRAQLEKQARVLALERRVVWTGPVLGRAKIRMLSAADVFVHTSRFEGLPSAVLEACALGRPCLVTPAADPLGRLGACGGGIACEPETGSIREGLERFLALDDQALEEMGRKSREMVRSEFSWPGSARKLARGLESAGIHARSEGVTG